MDWFVPAERPSVQTELLCSWNLDLIVLPSSVMWTIVQTTVDCMIKVTCTCHHARLCRRLQADGFAYFLTTANITKKKNPPPRMFLFLPITNVSTHTLFWSLLENYKNVVCSWLSISHALSFCDRLWNCVKRKRSYWDVWRGPAVIYLTR